MRKFKRRVAYAAVIIAAVTKYRRVTNVNPPNFRITDRLSQFAGRKHAAAPPHSFHTVTLATGATFEMAVDACAADPISQGIITGNPWFLDDYEFLFALMKPNDIVLDIGAHIGTFGLASAALGCHVLCIEASPNNANLIAASAAANGFAHLWVVPAAATNHDGTVEFLPNGPWGTIANSTVLASPATIYARELISVVVPAVSIDSLLPNFGLQHADFVKLDVEGGEVAALCGMSELLNRDDAPVILYESNAFTLQFFGHTPADLTKALEQFGFTNFMLHSRRLIPCRAREFRPECVVNCVALKGDFTRLIEPLLIEPRSHDDLARAIVSKTQSEWVHDRLYLAGALAQAEPELLEKSAVKSALWRLLHDPHEEVRSAAARSSAFIEERMNDQIQDDI